MKKLSIFSISTIAVFSACNSGNLSTERPPIIMGDSSTIITETDSTYLRNNFVDMELQTKALAADTNTGAIDTTTQSVTQTSTDASTNGSDGYAIKIGDVTLTLPGLKQKIKQGNGHHYILQASHFPKTILVSSSTQVLSIQQRTATRVYAKSKFGRLELGSLGTTSSDWKNLAVNKAANQYTVPSISNLSFKSLNSADLRNGINNSISKASLKQKDKDMWTNELKSVKTLQDGKLEVALYKVEWKVNTGSASTIITFTF